MQDLFNVHVSNYFSNNIFSLSQIKVQLVKKSHFFDFKQKERLPDDTSVSIEGKP